MITNLRYNSKDGILDFSDGIFATYENSGKSYELKLDTVKEYWDYANEEDVESLRLSTDGKMIIANFTTASDQGGVVTVWDSGGNLIHISRAEFGIASTIYDGYVYTLCAVHDFVTPLNYLITKNKFGTMDAWKEDEAYENISFSDAGAFETHVNGGKLGFEVDDNKYSISFDGHKYNILRKNQ